MIEKKTLSKIMARKKKEIIKFGQPFLEKNHDN